MPEPSTLSEALARFALNLRFDEIPAEVVDKAKDVMLDTVGICASSAPMDFGRSALALAHRLGGPPESSLIGFPATVAVHHAALANGVLAHGQDYDDTHTESMVHAGAALVPAALALSEATDASGRETLAALIAGLEVSIRLGLPARNRFHLRGFHTTSICCTFGAALMAARMFGHEQAAAVDAAGVAGSLASGLLECVPAGSGAKKLHAGWAASCGIQAAQFAQAGFTGPRTVFEGRLGVYNSLLRGEVPDLDEVLSGLGTRWEMLNIRPKLYPCCHYLQTFIECAKSARADAAFDPDGIDRIECRIAAGAVNIVCDPWEKKLAPQTAYEARFSLAFATAITLINGSAGISEFSDRYLGDARLLALMKRVGYVVEPRFNVQDMQAGLAIVFHDGRRWEREMPRVRGDAADPIDRDELLVKFRENVDQLNPALGATVADAIVGLDGASDAGGLMRALSEAVPINLMRRSCHA